MDKLNQTNNQELENTAGGYDLTDAETKLKNRDGYFLIMCSNCNTYVTDARSWRSANQKCSPHNSPFCKKCGPGQKYMIEK